MKSKDQKPHSSQITSILKENRVFKSPKKFSEAAHVRSFSEYKKLYRASMRNPERFWAKIAEELVWFKKWRKVLEWKLPFAKWFVGGKINVSYNCLDRHLSTWRKNKAAIIWEGEPGETRTLTYQELHTEVCKFANVLKSLGVVRGDRVAIYMPLIPEAAIAMLACARIGATHSIIFGGFSSQALIDRINDAKAKLVVTADGGYRRGSIVPLKDNVDEALKQTPSIEGVVVVKRTGKEVYMEPGRDHWWDSLMQTVSDKCEADKLDSEHPLFILYTSGTTGKPKGVVHTTGGYLVGVAITSKWVFDLKDTDTYWCTADIGWVTGHSYVVYGPLANGATTVMYEGAPNWPDPDRFWKIIDRHKISIFYTAPTAIRAFIRWGEQWPLKHSLESLRLLGTVGEPINPEAWMWYHKIIGKARCPIVDTWWQTETGAIMITPLPGATPTKPGTATLPFPGIDAEVVTKDGKPVGKNRGGYLVIRRPWPSMLRTIYGDPERFKRQYWKEIKGMYFTGDGARRDEDGYFWIMGRVDDVINVAGHRLGTAEIESALVSHDSVAEAAVVGRPDELKGTAICAFVTLEGGRQPSAQLKEDLRQHVVKEIGALARPDEIRFSDALPKTRSGKIMRRLLREIASTGSVSGDTTTLEDFSVLEKLRANEEE
jgi:acetyl-CoA synthetase